jgi:hypothetical protein
LEVSSSCPDRFTLEKEPQALIGSETERIPELGEENTFLYPCRELKPSALVAQPIA